VEAPLRALVLTSLALVGCAEVEKTFDEVIPAEDIRQVYVDLDRGAVSYTGAADSTEMAFEIRSWARGGSRNRASDKERSNDWGVQVVETELTAWGRSPSATAGVDFALAGPEQMDVEIVTLEGAAELYGVDGQHVVTADAVVGAAISGDVDLYAARGSIQAEIYPDFGSLVVLQAVDGDVTVGLPFGLQYDLEIFGDWDYPMDVQDLGFDFASMSPGSFSALTGGGNVVVEIYVEGGGVYVYEAPPI